MDAVRQTLAVLLVFALLGLALWKLRRAGNVTTGNAWWNRAPAGTRSLASLERLSLTPHHALHLVRMNGREVVVATHPQGCAILAQFPESSERAQA
ncbi:MAG: flagellar biosynthetic protein FliO [Bryobacteraceae bacterium]